MKRMLITILALVALILNVSCTPISEKVEDEKDVLEVNEGFLLDTLTFPSFFYQNASEEEIKESMEELGAKSYKINDNGSVTFKLTKARRVDLAKQTLSELMDITKDLVDPNSDNYVESFSTIDCNDDCSRMNIYVNSEIFHPIVMLYIYGLNLQATMYQLLSGKSGEDIDMIVNIIDDKTGEIIKELSPSDQIITLDYQNEIASTDTPDSYSISINNEIISTPTREIVEKKIQLGYSINVGDVMQIKFIDGGWYETVTPSNTTGYSYFSDVVGEKYFVLEGTLKNLSPKTFNILYISEVEILINNELEFSGVLRLESVEGKDFYGSVKPMQTLNLKMVASIPDEAYNAYNNVHVSMKIISSKDYLDNFFREDYPHEVLTVYFYN